MYVATIGSGLYTILEYWKHNTRQWCGHWFSVARYGVLEDCLTGGFLRQSIDRRLYCSCNVRAFACNWLAKVWSCVSRCWDEGSHCWNLRDGIRCISTCLLVNSTYYSWHESWNQQKYAVLFNRNIPFGSDISIYITFICLYLFYYKYRQFAYIQFRIRVCPRNHDCITVVQPCKVVDAIQIKMADKHNVLQWCKEKNRYFIGK